MTLNTSVAARPRGFWDTRRAGVLAAAAGVLVGAAVLTVPPTYLLVSVVGLATLVGMLLDPMVGLLAVLGSYFLQPSVILPELRVLHLQRWLVVAVLGAWLMNRAVRRPQPLVRHRLNLAMLLFLGATAASIPLAHWPGLAFASTLDFGKMVVLYALVANLVDSQGRLRHVVWLIVLCFGFVGMLQVLAHLGVYSSPYVTVATIDDRGLGSVYIRSGGVAGGFLGNPDDYAVGVLFVIPLAVALLLQERRRPVRLLAFCLVALFTFSLILTASRGGAVGGLALGLFAWVRSRRKFAVAVGGITLLCLLWVAAPSSFRDRMATLPSGSYRDDAGVRERFRAWDVARQMLAHRPLTGVGAGNYPNARWSQYRAPEERAVITAHSIYYLLAAELGVLGIAAFGFLIATVFMTNRRLRDQLRQESEQRSWAISLSYTLDASLVGYLVSGAFITVLSYPYPYLVAALTVVLSRVSPSLLDATGPGDPRPEQT